MLHYQVTRDNWSTVVWRTWHDCYNYIETISKDIGLLLCVLQGQHELHFKAQTFQQDGATLHTANDTMVKLEEMFNVRIMSKRSDFVWSERSPGLSSLNFFLWGYCKKNVYTNTQHNVPEFQRSLEKTFQVHCVNGSLLTSSVGLLTPSTEIKNILSTEFNGPYVTRKCK